LYREDGLSQEDFLVSEDIGEEVYVLEYPVPDPREEILLRES